MVELLRKVSEVNTEGFGAIAMCMADIDRDGKLESVFFQAIDHNVKRISAGGYPHEHVVRCITAMKLDGTVLWQVGTPMGFGYWPHHGIWGYEVADINADGRPEVLYVTERNGHNYLTILRSGLGMFHDEVETGANCVLQLCDIRGLGSRRDILVSTFLNPIYIYTDDLKPLWNCHFYGGAGHFHASYDIDEDGKEELFIGYNCVRADGTKIWWRPDLEPYLEEMKRSPHVDGLEVVDLDGDGHMELLMIGGNDIICLDAASGGDRWIFEAEHIQNAIVGNFLPDQPGLEVFAAEKGSSRSYLIDSMGHEIWRRDDLRSVFSQRIRLKGIKGDCIVVPSWLGRPPLIMDGQGRILQELDVTERNIRSHNEKHIRDIPDRGVWIWAKVADVDGDEEDEVVMFNRCHLWLFDQP